MNDKKLMNNDLVNLLSQHRLIELNHLYEEQMPVWPGDGRFFMSKAEDFSTGDGNYNCQLSLGDHCGTHIDAPVHFIEQGKSIDQTDVRQLMGRGRCMDMSHLPANSEISQAQLEEWESCHGEIVAHDIVLIRTGYDRKWQRRPHHAEFMENWAGLSGEGAAYLLRKGVTVFGTDSMSLDAFTSENYAAHRAVLSAGGMIIESLANLYRLPAEFTFIALPLRIKGASASPVRAVALVKDN